MSELESTEAPATPDDPAGLAVGGSQPVHRRSVWRGLAWTMFSVALIGLGVVRVRQLPRTKVMGDLAAAQEAYLGQQQQLQAVQAQASRVDQHLQDVRANHQRLLSMYDHCRSVDDFFIVEDDLMAVSWDSRAGHGFGGLCYLPDGVYELTATATLTMEKEEIFTETRTTDVRGGMVYESDVFVETGESNTLRIRFGGEVLRREFSPLRMGGYSRGGEMSFVRAPHLPLTRSPSVSEEQQLFRVSFYASDPEQDQKGRLRVQLQLAPKTPKRYWVLTPTVMSLVKRRSTQVG